MPSERDRVVSRFDKLLEAPLTRFPQNREAIDAPDNQGVYLIIGPRGKVLHVGKTNRGKRGLHQRLSNHLNGSSSFTKAYLDGNGTVLRSGHAFRFVEIEDARLRTLVEAYATGVLCPAHLGVGDTLKD